MIRTLLLVFVCALLSAVSYAQKPIADSLKKIQDPLFAIKDTATVPILEENLSAINQNYIYKLRLDSISKDFNLPYNEYVQTYIDIYAKRKAMFGSMLGLSNYYFPIFEKALKEFDIPNEIKYLPIIESAMNPHAVSKMGATGLWQFMFGTGKAYGLVMDNFVDERKDPIQASYAAAAYFRDSYEELGDWLLAIAAYNCGKGNVNRAIVKAGSRDFWEVRRFLPAETRNYVPAFIAAVYVMNYYDKHQITAKENPFNANTDTVQVNNFVSLPQLAEVLNLEENVLLSLNPSYKKKIVNGTAEMPKRIIMPKVQNVDLAKVYDLFNYNELDVDKQILAAHTDDIREIRKLKLVTHSTASKVLQLYKVKPGQSLFQIANLHQVEVQDLKVWNKLKSNSIVPGQNLKIYKHKKAAAKAKPTYLSYKVKAGDTLSDIAERYEGLTVYQIKKDNNLSKSHLKPGMILKISRS